jgi:hypothetical protein
VWQSFYSNSGDFNINAPFYPNPGNLIWAQKSVIIC